MTDRSLRSPGAAFLLSQLGGQVSRAWRERLAAAGMEPREVMLFRFVALNEGRSQAAVAAAIGLPASRIVALVDRLEARGWVERRAMTGDRRARVLHLTPGGRDVLERLGRLSSEHERELTRGLGPDERATLVALLERIAESQGLLPGVHPSFAEPPGGPDDADDADDADEGDDGGAEAG
jgi:DNA-binding MarR family transcriptional regulator